MSTSVEACKPECKPGHPWICSDCDIQDKTGKLKAACKMIEVDIEEINVAADIEYSTRKTGRSRDQIRDNLLVEAVVQECITAITNKEKQND